jgi:hypothetical protein
MFTYALLVESVDVAPAKRHDRLLNAHHHQAGADLQAVLDHLSGKPLGPETYKRIRERADRVTKELRQKHGEMNIAMELIREVRDEV